MADNPLDQTDIDAVNTADATLDALNLTASPYTLLITATTKALEYSLVNAIYSSNKYKTGSLPEVDTFLATYSAAHPPEMTNFASLYNSLVDDRVSFTSSNNYSALEGINPLITILDEFLVAINVFNANGNVNNLIPEVAAIKVAVDAIVKLDAGSMAIDVGTAKFWEQVAGHTYTHAFYTCSGEGNVATNSLTTTEIYNIASSGSITAMLGAKSLCTPTFLGYGGSTKQNSKYISFDGVTCSSLMDADTAWNRCVAGVDYDHGPEIVA